MTKINVMIVEDSRLVAEYVAGKLQERQMNVMAIHSTGEEALIFLNTTLPDLILMDIELAGAMDGISTAQIINEKYSIPVIYLSDYQDDKTVERAKKTLPANYLTKPFNEADLFRAIDLAFYSAGIRKQVLGHNSLREFIFVRTDNQVYLKMAYDDILYLKAGRSYCDLVTEKQTYTLSTSMNHVHEQIAHNDFVKVHRSFVINLGKITAIDGKMVKLGGHEIQMNDEAYNDLMSKVKLVK